MKIRITKTVYAEAKRVARDKGFSTFALFARHAAYDWKMCGEVPLEVSGVLTRADSVTIRITGLVGFSAGEVRSAIEREVRIYRQTWKYRYPQRMLDNAIYIEEYLTGKRMTFEEAQDSIDKMIEDRKKCIGEVEK